VIKNLLTKLLYWISVKSTIVGPKQNRTSGRMANRDRYADIKTRLSTESPIIIDGGANNGSTTDFFLRQYRLPVVHTFEAIPDLVETLKQKYAKCRNVTVYGVAIGAETKTVSFNIVNNLVSSSVLKPSALNRKIHGEKMDVCRVVEVKQIRLEDVMKDDQEIDLLKLDLQGYELEALKGCGRLLEHIKIITVEIEFASLYEDQPLFGDIDVFLRSNGFRLFNLYELYTQPDGQLTAGDAVYLNSNYF
jgi:FkbM family methyltransferase